MRKILILVLAVGLAILAGCSQEQLKKIDTVAEQVPVVTQTGEALLETPAGKLVPEPIAGGARMAGEVLLTVAAAWLAYRKKQTNQALEEVVVGNETFKKQVSDDALDAFKAAHISAQSTSSQKLVKKIKAKV